MIEMNIASHGGSKPSDVIEHYGRPNEHEVDRLEKTIIDGVQAQFQKSKDLITVEELAGSMVDQFHAGGKTALEHFYALAQVGELLENPELERSDSVVVLEVGSGIGGPARHFVSLFGEKITKLIGVDMTPVHVGVARRIDAWPQIAGKTRGKTHYVEGNVLKLRDLPAVDAISDASVKFAFMICVGMNIDDKETLAQELSRVMLRDGKFAVFDAMFQLPGGEAIESKPAAELQELDRKFNREMLTFPLPWATTGDISSVSSVLRYKRSFEAAGFSIVAERDVTTDLWEGSSYDAITKMTKEQAAAPAPLGIHVLMGMDYHEKICNWKKANQTTPLVLYQIVFQKN
jgi:SAM-dependent methyltransferase